MSLSVPRKVQKGSRCYSLPHVVFSFADLTKVMVIFSDDLSIYRDLADVFIITSLTLCLSDGLTPTSLRVIDLKICLGTFSLVILNFGSSPNIFQEACIPHCQKCSTNMIPASFTHRVEMFAFYNKGFCFSISKFSL